MPKTTELVPWSALPPENHNVTWGSNSKAQIVNLMRAGKTAEEISKITGNRLAFVKATIRNAVRPAEESQNG